jgi:hypothetical protein
MPVVSSLFCRLMCPGLYQVTKLDLVYKRQKRHLKCEQISYLSSCMFVILTES